MAAPLIIRFATDVAGAKAGLQDLAASVVSNMVKVGTAVKAANDNVGGILSVLSKVPSGVAGAVGAFAAFEVLKFALSSVDAAAKAAQERLDAVLKVASGAEGAGVGTSFFQRWRGEAEALNVEASKLEAMLTRAREASTTRLGTQDEGSNSPIGKRLGEHAEVGNISKSDLDRFTGAKDQEARIRVVLDLIEQLRQKGAQLAAFDIANKMFGPDFETKLRSGVDMVGKMRNALDSIKATAADGTRVLSPEEVDQAARLKATIDDTRRILADAIAPVSRDIARYQADQAQSAADFNRTLAEAAATLLGLYGIVSKISDAFTALGNLSIWDKISNALPRINTGAVFDLENTRTYGAPDESTRNKTGGPAPTALPAITVNPDKDKSRLLKGHASTGGADGEADDAVERYIKQLQKANDTAKAELDTVGKTNVEREKALADAKLTAAAREAGRDATEEERAKVTQVAEATAKIKDRTLDAKQAIEQTAEAWRSFGQMGADALGSILTEGKSLKDVLSELEKQLAKQLISAALTGSGPLAGILGFATPASAPAGSNGGLIGLLSAGAKTAIGGFRANGGPVSAGRAYTVGEIGQELFVPNQDGRMVPIDRNGGGLGGGLSLTFNDHVGVSPQPQVRRGSDGNLEVMVDLVTRRQAEQAARGRGDLVRSGAVSQRLRG